MMYMKIVKYVPIRKPKGTYKKGKRRFKKGSKKPRYWRH